MKTVGGKFRAGLSLNLPTKKKKKTLWLTSYICFVLYHLLYSTELLLVVMNCFETLLVSSVNYNI